MSVRMNTGLKWSCSCRQTISITSILLLIDMYKAVGKLSFSVYIWFAMCVSTCQADKACICLRMCLALYSTTADPVDLWNSVDLSVPKRTVLLTSGLAGCRKSAGTTILDLVDRGIKNFTHADWVLIIGPNVSSYLFSLHSRRCHFLLAMWNAGLSFMKDKSSRCWRCTLLEGPFSRMFWRNMSDDITGLFAISTGRMVVSLLAWLNKSVEDIDPNEFPQMDLFVQPMPAGLLPQWKNLAHSTQQI